MLCPPQARGRSTGGPWFAADGSLDWQAVGLFIQQEPDVPLRCAVMRLRDLLRTPAQDRAQVGSSGLIATLADQVSGANT